MIITKREKTKKEVIKVYSKEELKKSFDYLNNKVGSYRSNFDKTLLRFMIYSGVRVSEALLLNWSNIDFEKIMFVLIKHLVKRNIVIKQLIQKLLIV